MLDINFEMVLVYNLLEPFYLILSNKNCKSKTVVYEEIYIPDVVNS